MSGESTLEKKIREIFAKKTLETAVLEGKASDTGDSTSSALLMPMSERVTRFHYENHIVTVMR